MPRRPISGGLHKLNNPHSIRSAVLGTAGARWVVHGAANVVLRVGAGVLVGVLNVRVDPQERLMARTSY